MSKLQRRITFLSAFLMSSFYLNLGIYTFFSTTVANRGWRAQFALLINGRKKRWIPTVPKDIFIKVNITNSTDFSFWAAKHKTIYTFIRNILLVIKSSVTTLNIYINICLKTVTDPLYNKKNKKSSNLFLKVNHLNRFVIKPIIECCSKSEVINSILKNNLDKKITWVLYVSIVKLSPSTLMSRYFSIITSYISTHGKHISSFLDI